MTTQDTEAVQQLMPLRTSQEVDSLLLQRTVNYRAGVLDFEREDNGTPMLEHSYDNSAIIPKERALNDPAIENQPLTERQSQPQTKITHGLFRMFMYIDMIQATDKAGDPKAMKVHVCVCVSARNCPVLKRTPSDSSSPSASGR